MISENMTRRRIWQYVFLTLFLLLVHLLCRRSTWHGDQDLHSFFEVLATSLAFFVGGIALLRYYAKKHNAILFVALAFLGTGVLDAYHALVTSSFFSAFMPSPLTHLSPWSWNASRIFLSIHLFISWWAWKREVDKGEKGMINDKDAYLGITFLMICTFFFFALFPLPRAYYPELFLSRPEELIAGFFFLLALIGHFAKQDWRDKSHYLDHWLILSLIVGFMSQVAFMPFSRELFDPMFGMAHILKILSYVFVLVGLMISMFFLFRTAEQAKEQLRLQAIAMNSAPNSIIITDTSGNIQWVNPAFTAITGYTSEQAIGKTPRLVKSGKMPEELYQTLWETILAGKTWRGEIINKRRNGTHYYVDLSINPVVDDNGKVISFIGISQDITARKKAEENLVEKQKELERSNEDLQQFAYVASHDLQEPLRMVASYTQLLEKRYNDILDDKGRSFIAFAVDGARRMQDLISDLLTYSRVGTRGKEFKEVDLNAVLNQVLVNLKVAIEEKKADVKCDNLPTVLGDDTQLAQLFQNLLGNAIKFCKDRDPVVTVCTKSSNGEVAVAVSDNGIGIEKQFLDKIFVIFQRLHSKEEFEGTGIGLAICKKIVERHGGRIWVESLPEKGTTFHFTLKKNGG